MNRSRSNFTVNPSSSGRNLSSMPANASSSATSRGQVGLDEEYSAFAAANSGRWIAADFSPPDISEGLPVGVPAIGCPVLVDHRPEQPAQLGQLIGTQVGHVPVE